MMTQMTREGGAVPGDVRRAHHVRSSAEAEAKVVESVIQAGSRQTVLWLLREPRRRRSWVEFRYVIVSLPVAIVGFVFTVVTITVGIVSFGILVGPPLLALSSLGVRGLAAVSRGLAGRLLGMRVAPPPPFRSRPGLVGWMWSGITDAASWRARAYLVLKLPVAVAGYLVAGWTWVGGLSGLTYPLRWGILDQMHVRDGVNPLPGSLTTLEGNLVVVPVGVALLIAAPWLTRAVVCLDQVLIARLIGPTSLAERVHDLEQTRAHAVDDSAARLRRIERDLHDGAQAQMIAVAMKLGLARENLGGTAGQAAKAEAEAVQRALELVDAAHSMAKDAITELRDLAHGIHPPVLDHGLSTALATLAARSAVPVELVADLPERPSAAIETIAYFCAAELLANVAKHSRASRATVEAVHVPGLLRVRVGDDGHGGARADLGSGLAGLIERLRTVDGRMEISSPPGGPTVVTVELPSHA
jgi:signal transduction histidine kinase